MKKIIAMLFVFMLLFSCAKEKTVTGVVNNEELHMSITEEAIAESEVIEEARDIVYNPIDESRDIFNGLFDDIKDDNYDEWGDDFTVTYVRPPEDEPGAPEEMYIVENETISIIFYNHLKVFFFNQTRERREAQGKRSTGFLPLIVRIKRNTNEYRLGNYIGKDISEALNDFDNQYSIDTDYVYWGINGASYLFRLREGEINIDIMTVGIRTVDNIITEIVYKYFFQNM